MSYNIVPTSDFKNDFKPLLKKHPSLKREVEQLGQLLETNPETGTPIGKNCFKIRLAIQAKEEAQE
jgi:hypothetical protein